MKNRKFRYFALFFVVCGFVSCKNENLMFHADDAIYFKVSKDDLNIDKKLIINADTVGYSFAYEDPKLKEYTIKIPMEIVGLPVEKDRKYKIVVETKSTTGVLGKHFRVLDDYYIMPKGVGVDTLKIVALRDPELRSYPKDLALKLVATDDFGLGRKEDLSLTIRISDQLQRPDWWADDAIWTIIFGPYHYIKHQEWIKIATKANIYGAKTGLPGDLDPKADASVLVMYPMEIMAIKTLQQYFEKNPRHTLEDYPEDPNYPGDLIVIPNPF